MWSAEVDDYIKQVLLCRSKFRVEEGRNVLLILVGKSPGKWPHGA
jgi:hypothetical protein